MVESPPPTEPVKPLDPKMLDAHLAREARALLMAEEAIQKASGKASEATGADTTTLQNGMNEAARQAIRDDNLKKIDAAHHAQYTAHANEKLQAFKEAIPNSGKVASTLAHVERNSGRYAGVAAALLAAGALLPGKEVEKPDGGTEKKGSLFKKALVAVGAVLAVGLAANKFGPVKGFAEKEVGRRVAAAAQAATGPAR